MIGKESGDFLEGEGHARRVAVIVLSAGPAHEIHHRNESAQRETFAHDLKDDVRFLFVRGDPRLRGVDFDDVARVLRVPVVEAHEKLLDKTVFALDWVIREWCPDFVLRTNTSSYFHVPTLRDEVRRLPLTNCYSGVIGTFGSQAFASGAGLWMSRDVAELVRVIEWNRNSGVNDDVAIGMYLADRNIRPRPMSRNDVGDFRLPAPCYHSRCKGRQSSGADDLMRRLHLVYSATDSARLRSALGNLLRHQRRQLLEEGRRREFVGAALRSSIWLRESERRFQDFLFPIASSGDFK